MNIKNELFYGGPTREEFNQIKEEVLERNHKSLIIWLLATSIFWGVKDAYSFEKANQITLEGMGTQFDSRLEKYFLAARPKLEAYYSLWQSIR